MYVRAEAWQIGALYGDAIDAWHGAVDRHPGDRTPPLGAPLFYEGPGVHGHIVICTRANSAEMRSTDMPSSGVVSEDVIAWIENHWGGKYLGWTEDLNAVDLPLETEDEMKEEDFDRIRKIVRQEVWEKDLPVNKPDGTETKKSAKQIIRETLQRVQK